MEVCYLVRFLEGYKRERKSTYASQNTVTSHMMPAPSSTFIYCFRKFSSSVQENLFRGPGDLSDLVAINIQRSRERGVPSYITYRNSGVCNLNAEVKSFDDLAKIGFLKQDIEKLKYVYEDVRDVDLFTGGRFAKYRGSPLIRPQTGSGRPSMDIR